MSVQTATCLSIAIRKRVSSPRRLICACRTRSTASTSSRMRLLHLPRLGNRGAYLIQQMNDKLVAHKNYIHEIGKDMPEILDWKWHLPESK